MSKQKSKITAIDVILVLVILIICAFALLRNVNVSKFNNLNVEKESVVTVSVKGVDKDNFAYFRNGDSVYAKSGEAFFEFGDVAGIRSSPAVYAVPGDNEYVLTPDFTKIDIVMDIKTDCLYDERGFYSIKHNYIAPGYEFSADNGRIKFNFEVVSVKSVD